MNDLSNSDADNSDAELIGRVLAGETTRFGALVDRHGTVLLAYLRARTSSPELAQDLFQETWVRALERLSDLIDRNRFRGWLFTIALNELRQLRRRAGREPVDGSAGAQESDVQESRSEGREPIERMLDRELEEQVARAVEALPPRQREVFRLRTIGGLSHDEIASALDISTESSRVHHHWACQRLRQVLSDHPDSGAAIRRDARAKPRGSR